MSEREDTQEVEDTKKPIRVFAAVTSRDGTSVSAGIQSLYSGDHPGVHVTVAEISGIWPVDYMRELVVKKALAAGEWDYLWFIDDDISPPKGAALMALHDKDVIAGSYFALQMNSPQDPRIRWVRNVKDSDGKMQEYVKPAKGLFQIDGCGMGCTMIHRRVLESLESPMFKYDWEIETEERKGEDFDFCNKAKAAGFEIWCDPEVMCSHHKLLDLKLIALLVMNERRRQKEQIVSEINVILDRNDGSDSWDAESLIEEIREHLNA